MDISLKDLKVALERAQVAGFTEASDLAGFTFGYLSAGPLGTADEDVKAEAVQETVRYGGHLDDLPVGTEVVDTDGEKWVKFDVDSWTWFEYADGHTRLTPEEYYDNTTMLKSGLPAKITKIGA